MQYKELTEVLGIHNVHESMFKQIMVSYLATQKDVIPTIMSILEEERKQNKELVSDMNVNLTRNTFFIQNPTLATAGSVEKQREFFLEETKAFYTQYKDRVRTAGIKIWSDLP